MHPDECGERGEFDFCVYRAAVVEDRCAEAHEAEAAAALPVHRLADAALLAVEHFFQARHAVRLRMLAHLNADPAAPHFLGNGSGGAGAEKAV